MTRSNGDVVRAFFQAFAQRDLQTATAQLHDDLVTHLPGSHRFSGEHHGAQAWFELAREVMEVTGGTLRLEPHDVLESDDHAVALVKVTAERDGRAYAWDRVFVYHFADGRIRDVWIHESDQAAVDRLLA